MSDKYEGLPPLPKPLSTSKHWDGGIDWPLAGERAARLEREDQLRSLLQERDQLRPVEPPQWEDYFRALKLSYPENLTAIYVAKEVYSMFMSALARESPEDAWRQQPDSQGWWWHAEDRLLKEVMLHAVTKFELKQAAETIRQMTELLREYRYDRFDIRHGFCGTRVAGLVNLIEIDERCSLCIKADLLLKENK